MLIAKNKDKLLDLGKTAPVRFLSDALLLAHESDPEALVEESQSTGKSVRAVVQARRKDSPKRPAHQTAALKAAPKAQTKIQPSPVSEEEEEENLEWMEDLHKAECEKKGLPYHPPVDSKIVCPELARNWVYGFVEFMAALDDAPLSDEARAYVMDCIGDAHDFLDRYDRDLLPDNPDPR
jgi:hypothetical protein